MKKLMSLLLALIMVMGLAACGEAVPSTPIELVSRLTEQAVTPSTLETAFSTRALQAAHDMPVTLYCCTPSPAFG